MDMICCSEFWSRLSILFIEELNMEYTNLMPKPKTTMAKMSMTRKLTDNSMPLLFMEKMAGREIYKFMVLRI